MAPNVTYATAKGGRPYQEDRFVTGEIGVPGNTVANVLAVMDGHGGSDCAERIATMLVDTLDNACDDAPDVPTMMRLAVKRLVEETDKEQSGSTMSLVLIEHVKSAHFVAHVAVIGDSPVMIGNHAGVYFVAPGHNVRSNLEERKAAVDRGGVYEDGYIWDPMLRAGLQMSRLFGDALFGSILSREPDCYSIGLGEKSFVLVASDGIFDPNPEDPKEIEEYIHVKIRNGADADDLVADALAQMTQDNATAVLWQATETKT